MIRATSCPTMNVLSRRTSVLHCLHQSCGQLSRFWDQSCPLNGALSHTSTRCASPSPTAVVTPAAVVVVATPTNIEAIPTLAVPAVVTVGASLFSPVAFCQLFVRGSTTRRARGARLRLSARL